MVELAENRDLGPPGYMKDHSVSGFLGPSPYPKIVERNRVKVSEEIAHAADERPTLHGSPEQSLGCLSRGTTRCNSG